MLEHNMFSRKKEKKSKHKKGFEEKIFGNPRTQQIIGCNRNCLRSLFNLYKTTVCDKQVMTKSGC